MWFFALLAVAPMASGGNDVHQGAAAAAEPAKEKKICRAVVRTGSIMPTRICMTKAEWKEFQDHNERDNEAARIKRNGTLDPRAQELPVL